jgi:hypothetical protein
MHSLVRRCLQCSIANRILCQLVGDRLRQPRQRALVALFDPGRCPVAEITFRALPTPWRMGAEAAKACCDNFESGWYVFLRNERFDL